MSAIENVTAYEAAKKRNIINNAKKTFAAKYPTLDTFLTHALLPDNERHHTTSDFIISLINAWSEYGKLSEKQADALTRYIDKQVEWNANRKKRREDIEQREADMTPLPEGRQEFTGRIIGVKLKQDYYVGYGNPTYSYKVVVLSEDGYKVFMSEPKKLYDGYTREVAEKLEYEDYLKTLTISVSVDITNAKDSNAFNFGKRPTKVKILKPETE